MIIDSQKLYKFKFLGKEEMGESYCKFKQEVEKGLVIK